MQHFWVENHGENLPVPGNQDRLALERGKWIEQIAHLDGEIKALSYDKLLENPEVTRLLDGIFANSPYLSGLIQRDPLFCLELIGKGPENALETCLQSLNSVFSSHPSRPEMARTMRIAKAKIALASAMADISGYWTVEQVTKSLSDLAEACLDCACGVLLREGAQAGHYRLKDLDHPQRDSGLIVLGMGKFGSRELNYSSDIDIIVMYDPDVVDSDDPWELQKHFVRLAKNLVAMMEERDTFGYVFRTDLRLRPDPGSTPLALSVLAAETYYESIGQNWERAAMIKARPVAGDRKAGDHFIKFLRPFIWRKNLDFAAIEDIHSIKRQINAHRGLTTIEVPGHNVKLGRGGIREVEFYAQTQQLIWGGKIPKLRERQTCTALRELVKINLVEEKTADDLIDSYRYLRRVEHRIQMVNDAQSHTLPEDDEGLREMAEFLGYKDLATFSAELLSHIKRVEHHYSELFAESPSLGSASDQIQGNLVFTGAEVDPNTMETLRAMGYDNPQNVDSSVRGWHHGRYRATRSTRSRQILTELMPVLLRALSKTLDPDGAFQRFDDFLSKLPSGVQLFSMFQSNPQLLDLVAEVMGEAPRLAEHLGRNPSLLESVLSPDFFTEVPTATKLIKGLQKALQQADDLQDILDISRRWTNDRKFQIGVLTLRDIISTRDAAHALSDLAEAVITVMLPKIRDELALQHGIIEEGGDMAVIALGKAGSREMTPSSDLDLVFIYDVSADCPGSNGKRPLGASQYFARLSQRFINALTAPTGEGTLYEVDMRLRPSGNSGPIACSLDAFVRYHQDEAWTWEHMALTRARVISGNDELRTKINHEIKAILTAKRDQEVILRDVAEMRDRMLKEHGTDIIWEIKHYRGGIVDIEFIAQYLQLIHGHDHPEILVLSTSEVLERAAKSGLLDPQIASDLCVAFDLWQRVQGILRLTMAGKIKSTNAEDIPEGLKADLAKTGGEPTFDRLLVLMNETADKAFNHYKKLIADPAAALPAKEQPE